MNTNMTGFKCFQKSLCPCALDESSLNIGRVKMVNYIEVVFSFTDYEAVASSGASHRESQD